MVESTTENFDNTKEERFQMHEEANTQELSVPLETGCAEYTETDTPNDPNVMNSESGNVSDNTGDSQSFSITAGSIEREAERRYPDPVWKPRERSGLLLPHSQQCFPNTLSRTGLLYQGTVLLRGLRQCNQK